MTASRAGARLLRRQFLRSVGTGLAGATALACGDSDDEPIEPPPPEVGDYRGVIDRYFDDDADFDNAAFIGRHYVRQEDMTSSEAFDASERTRDFIDDMDSESATVDALEERSYDDFVEVRVRDVRGWTLSRTEVDLCVLAHLLQHVESEDA